MPDFAIRPATPEDAACIAHHRARMFEDMNFSTPELRDRAVMAFIPWVSTRLASGEYLGFLAVDGNRDILAGVGLWIHDWPPTPGDDGGRRGWIGNVYTEPAFRGQGIARRLMEVLIDSARQQNLVTVWLHASHDGQHLYESLGFIAKPNEMQLRLVP